MKITITEVTSSCVVLEPHPGAASLGVGAVVDVGPEIGGGGFGTVYRCDAVGASLSPGLVIKRHTRNGSVRPEECAAVLAALQSAVAQRWAGAPAGPRALLPGIPYWVGRALWDGDDVVVSLSRDLGVEGYTAFEGVLGGLPKLKAWLALDVAGRLGAAQSFAGGHALAEELDFVHADINVENVFVDPTGGRAAIIDWDCGVLPGSPNGIPLAWGKPDDFIAPEVKVGGAPDPALIGLLTERWAVGYMVHYLLFGVGPLFFLKTLSDQDIAAYLSTHTWPDIDTTSPLFHKPNLGFYGRYLQDLAELPAAVVDRFRQFVTDGSADPASRPSSAEWRDALQAVAVPPVFDWVTVAEAVTAPNLPVHVSWSAPAATAVHINGVGPYPPDGWVELQLHHTSSIVLEAVNPFGTTVHRTDDIVVLGLPLRPRFLVESPKVTVPPLEFEIQVRDALPATVVVPAPMHGRLQALRNGVGRFFGRRTRFAWRSPAFAPTGTIRRIGRPAVRTTDRPSFSWRGSSPGRRRFGG